MNSVQRIFPVALGIAFLTTSKAAVTFCLQLSTIRMNHWLGATDRFGLYRMRGINAWHPVVCVVAPTALSSTIASQFLLATGVASAFLYAACRLAEGWLRSHRDVLSLLRVRLRSLLSKLRRMR